MSTPLGETCRAAVDAARRAGADEAEAYAQFSRGVTARAEQNDLSGAEASESFTLGLRVLCGGAQGFATLNRVDDATLQRRAASAEQDSRYPAARRSHRRRRPPCRHPDTP